MSLRPPARAAALALAVALGACLPDAPAPSPAAPATASPEASAVATARALTRALSRGELPAGVDRAAAALTDVATREQRGPRAVEALHAAGDLLAARYRLARDPADLRAADALYRAAGRDPAVAGACAALRARAALLAAEGTPPVAGAAHDEYESRCVPPPLRAARAPAAVVPGAGREVARARRVVLDPGHGGHDPGAIGPTGLYESVVTLDVARRVAERLSAQYGVQVVLTRDTDTYVPLEDRAAHANAAGADLFVSIHCNASTNPEARGIATFVLDTQSPRVAARVSAREGEIVVDDPVASPDLGRILADLRLTRQGSRSVALAEALQGAMLHDARLFFPDAQDMGIQHASFHVLVTARMPSVLVELSFISSAVEEPRLRSERYRDLLASALARAIAGFAPQ